MIAPQGNVASTTAFGVFFSVSHAVPIRWITIPFGSSVQSVPYIRVEPLSVTDAFGAVPGSTAWLIVRSHEMTPLMIELNALTRLVGSLAV